MKIEQNREYFIFLPQPFIWYTSPERKYFENIGVVINYP